MVAAICRGVALALLLFGSARAQQADELLAAIARHDAAAVSAALRAGAQPSLPEASPAVLAVVDALAAIPASGDRGPARATLWAFVGAMRAAGHRPEAPAGQGGSLASRLAAVEGERSLFLRVAAALPAEARCALLGQVLAAGEGPAREAAEAMLPLIGRAEAGSSACGAAFAHAVAPALAMAMLDAGMVPAPEALPDLIRRAPEGDEALFGRLLALDLAAPPRPALDQLGQDVLEDREPRSASLASGDRWRRIVETTRDLPLCAALPGQVVRGWLSIPPDAQPWLGLLRETTAALLRRCPAAAFEPALGVAAGDGLWHRLAGLGEDESFRAFLAAGLRPAGPDALAASLACDARPGALSALLDLGGEENPGALMPAFVTCLGGLEASRPGEAETLRLLLGRGASPDAPVEGDAPVAIAAQMDREDIVAMLAERGARPSRLSPERAFHWRHRRLAAMVGEEGPGPGSVPPRLLRLGRGLLAWHLVAGCALPNCDQFLILREGPRYRLILRSAGHDLRLENANWQGVRNVRVTARTGAASHLEASWRYEGDAYRPWRCQEVEEGEAAPARRSDVACVSP
ncbi:hypothetical protein [Roseococcus sp. YIM B11640]|uniref:hypothetical protein n=1 Tax=Roseococcus sp. YIM B11640 TaxID=3133973 RepID=UPI003C79E79B